ncbi:MAG: FxsA family protein [Thiohalomonadales bacterium]|nr:FxsA family protein [Thiohalomonadales bacterium]
MPIFRYLFILFLAVPIIEIYFLIKVGDVIGAWPTVLLVVLTAILGVWLLRWQGLTTLTRVQASLQRGELPAQAMLEGMLLLIAGALLLTPGFVTDSFGFLILVPPLRHQLAGWLLKRGLLQAGMPPRHPPGQSPGHRTIEGEFEKRDE